jgi:acyl carrier protein
MAPDTFDRVRQIIAKYLGVPLESVGEDSRFEDLGIDSLGALELIFQIEEEFKVSVPDERVREFTTMKAACEAIETLQKAGATAG